MSNQLSFPGRTVSSLRNRRFWMATWVLYSYGGWAAWLCIKWPNTTISPQAGISLRLTSFPISIWMTGSLANAIFWSRHTCCGRQYSVLYLNRSANRGVCIRLAFKEKAATASVILLKSGALWRSQQTSHGASILLRTGISTPTRLTYFSMTKPSNHDMLSNSQSTLVITKENCGTQSTRRR